MDDCTNKAEKNMNAIDNDSKNFVKLGAEGKKCSSDKISLMDTIHTDKIDDKQIIRTPYPRNTQETSLARIDFQQEINKSYKYRTFDLIQGIFVLCFSLIIQSILIYYVYLLVFKGKSKF